MKKIRSLGVLMLMALTCILLAVTATAAVLDSGTCGVQGDNLTWTLDDAGTLTISGTGEMADYPGFDLYQSEIQTVVIQEGVTSIGADAFYYCWKLNNISLPDTLTEIGNSAFCECGQLTSISLPDSVTTIGRWAFGDCYNLEEVFLGNNTQTIGDCAFSNTKLTSLTIPASVQQMDNSCVSQYSEPAVTLTFLGAAPSTNYGKPFYGSIICYYPAEDASWTALIGSGGFDPQVTWQPYTAHDHQPASIPGKAPTCTETGLTEGARCAVCQAILTPQKTIPCIPHTPQTVPGIPTTCTRLGLAEGSNCADCGKILVIQEPSLCHTFENGACTVCGTGEPVASGKCGNNLLWMLEADGTLRIGGIGDMQRGWQAWLRYRSQIKAIDIQEGVTAIAPHAFYRCTAVESVQLPNTLTHINDAAFALCSSLKNIIIPDSVIHLGFESFVQTGLTSITIPSNVCSSSDLTFADCPNLTTVVYAGNRIDYGNGSGTGMGSDMFYNCTNLTEVTIADGVTELLATMFKGCTSLTKITIPDSVTDLGYETFDGCTALQTVSLPNSVTSIDPGVFRNCTSLGSLVLPDSVTTIEADAFSGCSSLTSLALPNHVTTIDGGAFNNCIQLKDLTIPASVSSIDQGAFAGCFGLETFQVAPENEYYCSDGLALYTKDKTILYGLFDDGATTFTIPDGVQMIGSDAFRDCKMLTSVTIPDSVTSIGQNAFAGCTSLTGITIPDSVTRIEQAVFAGCTSLTSIRLPALEPYNTYLSNGLFQNCTSLTSVELPENLTYIGAETFYGCTSLRQITLPDSVTGISISAFENCVSLEQITFPEAFRSFGDRAFAGCSNLADINIPASVNSIGSSVFVHCAPDAVITVSPENPNFVCEDLVLYNKGKTELLSYYDTQASSFTIPDSVTKIGRNAFLGCTNLTGVTIPDSVTTIDYNAFQDCTALSAVTIPDSVTEIYAAAFQNTGLVFLTIPDSVTSLGEFEWGFVFADCKNLTKVTVGNGLTVIESGTFENCPNLVSVSLGANIQSIQGDTFRNCTSLSNITLPQGVTYISNSAFRGCTGLKQVAVGNESFAPDAGISRSMNTVSRNATGTIGAQAFEDCTALEDLTIPESIGTIEGNAFYGCSSLQHVTIPSSVTTIGDGAFYNCDALETVTFQGSAPAMDNALSNGTTVSYPGNDTTWDALVASKAGYLNMEPYGEQVPASVVIADSGTSLSLEGTIYFNQYVTVEGIDDLDYIADHGGLLIWNEPVTAEAAIYGAQDALQPGLLYNGHYQGKPEFGQQTVDGVAAKEYADEIYLRVYLQLEDGSYTYGPLVEFSVQDYCEKWIGQNTYPALTDLCAAMLHFGANAQSFFQYNTADLANANIAASHPAPAWDTSLLTPLIPPNTTLAGTGDIRENGHTISLDGAITINFYFASDLTLTSGTLYVWDGATGELTQDNVSYTAELLYTGEEWGARSQGIATKRYGETLYAQAELVDADGTVHYSDVVPFSVEQYAADQIQKAADPQLVQLVQLVQQMTTYGDFAQRWFAQNN